MESSSSVVNEKLSKAIDDCIQELQNRIKKDTGLSEEKLTQAAELLASINQRREQGDQFTLLDLRAVLELCKTVLIPSVMLHETRKLATIKNLAKSPSTLAPAEGETDG